MISFLCDRCSRLTLSEEGLHCFYCDQEKIRSNELRGSLYLPVSEPGNEEHGYYEPVADVNTQKFVRDLMRPKPSTEISIQTADNDFYLHKETSRRQGEEICTKTVCSTKRKIFSDFEKDSTNKKKPILGTLNLIQDTFHQTSGTRNPQTGGTFLQLTNDTSLASNQRTNSSEQFAIDGLQNNHDSVRNLKRQEIVEPTEHVKETGKLDFVGTIHFQPENLPLSLSSECWKTVNEQARGYMHGFSSPLDRKNSKSKDFQVNLVAIKTSAEQADIYSDRWLKRKCLKCGKMFWTGSKFYAHIQSNCDPKPFKCDKCGYKFNEKWKLKKHQSTVHV